MLEFIFFVIAGSRCIGYEIHTRYSLLSHMLLILLFYSIFVTIENLFHITVVFDNGYFVLIMYFLIMKHLVLFAQH
jgi:hypothetical protein